MSELEKARAGVFLSILALTLTWLLFSSGGEKRTDAQSTQPVVVCAATHGAICDVAPSTGTVATSDNVAYLGEVVVTASRVPTPLGRLVVSATRLSPDPGKVRLAESERKQSIVVQ